ncbi:MAG: hypothetical protein AAGB46_08940 [Verrucomicrobiota bacterium]
MKKLFLVGLALCRTASVGAQTEIKPYASEASVHNLVGQKTKVSGVYYKDVFDAPVIMIKGHTFYLLQNPPSKRTYSFPSLSREATVSGTLYFYDHSQLNNAEYGAIDQRYFFFNVDESKLEFGEAKVSEGLKQFMRTWKYDTEYTMERAESFKTSLSAETKNRLENASPEAREFGEALLELADAMGPAMMDGYRLVIGESTIEYLSPQGTSEIHNFEIIRQEGKLLEVKHRDFDGTMASVEFEILPDGHLSVSKGELGRRKGPKFYYEP